MVVQHEDEGYIPFHYWEILWKVQVKLIATELRASFALVASTPPWSGTTRRTETPGLLCTGRTSGRTRRSVTPAVMPRSASLSPSTTRRRRSPSTRRTRAPMTTLTALVLTLLELALTPLVQIPLVPQRTPTQKLPRATTLSRRASTTRANTTRREPRRAPPKEPRRDTAPWRFLLTSMSILAMAPLL